MHRGKGSFKSREIKNYLEKVKKINTRKVGSIWDVINDKTLQFAEKVNYIRHHYVYYDGHYELFYDETGKPTNTKRLLDNVIRGVVNGIIDPSELNSINKTLAKDHKRYMEEQRLAEEENLNTVYQEAKKFNETEFVNNIPEAIPVYKQIQSKEAQVYIDLIDKYLNTLSSEDRKNAETWSYRDLKKVAKWWDRNNQPEMNLQETVKNSNLRICSNDEFIASYKKYIAKTEK